MSKMVGLSMLASITTAKPCSPADMPIQFKHAAVHYKRVGGSGGNGHLCEWVGWGTHTVTRILTSFGNLLSRSTHAALSTIENPFFLIQEK